MQETHDIRIVKHLQLKCEITCTPIVTSITSSVLVLERGSATKCIEFPQLLKSMSMGHAGHTPNADAMLQTEWLLVTLILILIANIVTTSKAPVTTSVALVSTSFLLLLVRHLLLLAWHLFLLASCYY